MRKFRRRDCLKLGAAVALTPLAKSVSLQAQGEATGTIPKRFIALNMPHGWANEEFTMNAGGTLGSCLAPLQPFQDRLLLLKNLNFANVGGEGDTHQLGHVMQLSGEMADTNADLLTHARGISIDRAIAHGVRGDAPFASYAFGADSGVNISTDGPGQAVWGETDPGLAYRDLFGGFTGPVPDPAVELERMRRRRIVDFARGEYASARTRLSGASQRRIELHENALFELGTRIDGFRPTAFCEPPETWVEGATPAHALKMHVRYPLVVDMAVAALSCGITNVASISVTANPIPGEYVAGIENPELGHHLLSHSIEGVTPEAQASWRRDSIRSQAWFTAQMADLMGKLAAIEEIDGSSMLDHTTILMVTEVGGINDHSQDGVSFVLGGNVDGYFRTGREVDCGGAPHANLFSTLMDAYGLGDAPFGSFGTGPLDLSV